MPATSTCTASPFGTGFTAGAFAGAGGAPEPARSAKLVFPSFPCTRSTLSPERVTRSTTTCRDRSGSSASDTLTSSKRAKTLSLLRSDSEVLPTATPMLGNSDSPILPSTASVRPVLSFTIFASSPLYLLGSKVATTTAIASATSTIRPPLAYSAYFTIFISQDLAAGRSFVGHPERHVPGRDVPRRGLGMAALVVEEDVGAESFQERPLVQPPEKQRFVDTDVPGAQRAHDAFVGGGAARGHESGSNRRAVGGIFRLDPVQGRKETLERPAGERLPGRADLARRER